MAEVGIAFSFTVGDAVSFPKPFLGKTTAGPATWDPVDRWLRGKRPKTQQLYRQHMARFLPSAGLESEAEFLSWAQTQDPVAVEEGIHRYLSKLPQASRGVGASALKTFIELNGSRRLSKDLVSNEVRAALANREFQRGFEKEEVNSILRYLDDDLQQLFVYFEKDTGFRANVTVGIRYHNFKEDFEAGKDYCHVRLWPKAYTGKKRAGITFIGPNTVGLLRQLIKKGVVTPNPDRCDPIADPSDKIKNAKCTCTKLFPWGYETIRETLRLAMKKAGVDPKLQPTHGFRKFFENSLDRVQPAMDVDKKRQLEGHALGVRWNYTDQRPKSLLPLYQQAYQFLDLTEEAAADAKVKDLQEQLKSLNQQVGHYKELEIQLAAVNLQMGRVVRLYEDAARRIVELENRR